MDIRLSKLTSDRHRLEIVWNDASFESATLETRSYLMHDLLHLAVETEARLDRGFWGCLARGKTMSDMNDRTGQSMGDASADLLVVEQIVGVLTAATKGVPSAQVLAALSRWTEPKDACCPRGSTSRSSSAHFGRTRAPPGPRRVAGGDGSIGAAHRKASSL